MMTEETAEAMIRQQVQQQQLQQQLQAQLQVQQQTQHLQQQQQQQQQQRASEQSTSAMRYHQSAQQQQQHQNQQHAMQQQTAAHNLQQQHDSSHIGGAMAVDASHGGYRYASVPQVAEVAVKPEPLLQPKKPLTPYMMFSKSVRTHVISFYRIFILNIDNFNCSFFVFIFISVILLETKWLEK